ncbi:MAG: TadE/TadG family type IV pilus assembly protein [Pirellulaceae bacterium]
MSTYKKAGGRHNLRHVLRKTRRGQALLEFAILIPIIIILLGATISFGLFFFQANALQQAVDVAAQEIARIPFEPEQELGLNDFSGDASTLLWDPANTSAGMDSDGELLRKQIYHPKFLVIRLSDYATRNPDPVTALQMYVADMPLLNRLLYPMMVQDPSYDPEDTGRGVIRYPGAVVNFIDPDKPDDSNEQRTEETVLIPIIGYGNDGDNDSVEMLLQWVPPVEEIEAGDGARPFSLSATSSSDSFVPGMAALRLNYPAQSTTLVNRVGDEGEVIVIADDQGISDVATGSAYTLAVLDEVGVANTQIHSGRYGLGRQAALLRSVGVRPYRKVLSVQAIYRREVFK